MINVERFVRPNSVAEAVALLQEPAAFLLAGGTAAAMIRDEKIRTVIDLSELEELRILDANSQRIRLGAMVTMTQIRRHNGLFPALVQCVRGIGSTPLRNVITVGGELAHGVYWNDLPVLLLAADARVELQDANGIEQVPVATFLAEHPKRALSGGRMITAVEIPLPADGVVYEKFARTQVDYTLCDVAVRLQIADGVVKDARVAVGGVVPLARRVPEAEQALAGAPANPESFDRAARAAVDALAFRPDFRISREYQKHLVETLVRRQLKAAAAKCPS